MTNLKQEFGKVAVLLGGRAGLGGAERRCGKAKQAARRHGTWNAK